MHNKRNILLLVSFISLLMITVLLYWFVIRDRDVQVDENLFMIEDLDQVDRVVVQSAKDTITIALDGSRWIINNKHDADRQMIEVLFATLQQVKVKRPVAAVVKDSVADAVDKYGSTVSIYVKSELIQQFKAGGNSQKTQAYFMDAQKREPYIMIIPGYRVYACGILELDESGWRDKYVFGFNWRNFRQLDARFSKSADNFSVVMDQAKGYFAIAHMAATDTSRLNTFLDNVSLLTADTYFEPASGFFDSLRNITPEMELDVSNMAGKHFTVSFYPKQSSEKAILGVINGKEAAWFQMAKIRPLMYRRHYFKLNNP